MEDTRNLVLRVFGLCDERFRPAVEIIVQRDLHIAADHTFYFDRSQAGQFDRRVNYPRRHTFKIESRRDRLKVRVLVDNSVAELFINDGEYTMSEQFFPEKPFQILKIEPPASDLKIWKLKNIWSR